MRASFLLIFLFLVTISSGQSLTYQKKNIDTIVTSIDSDKSQKFYSALIVPVSKILLPIRYHYWTKNGKITKIVRLFKMHNDSTEQTFYFKDNRLVYSTESIKSYYFEKGQKDSIGWGGAYYFSKGKLIDLITLGHGKSETEEWNPQAEVLSNCNNAKNDIKRYLAKKNRG